MATQRHWQATAAWLRRDDNAAAFRMLLFVRAAIRRFGQQRARSGRTRKRWTLMGEEEARKKIRGCEVQQTECQSDQT